MSESLPLNLTVHKESTTWYCDCPTLPGSPPIGLGATAHEAVVNWLRAHDCKVLIQEPTCGRVSIGDRYK